MDPYMAVKISADAQKLRDFNVSVQTIRVGRRPVHPAFFSYRT